MTAIAAPAIETSVIESTVLGTLEIVPEQIYSFQDELYGFPGARSFALLPADRDGFFWLQSLDFEALTFLLIDPFQFVDGYSVEVGPEELGDLAPAAPTDLLVLSIMTLPRETNAAPTVNLQGPLVMDISARKGKQVVVESPYGTRHPIRVTSAA